MEKKALIVLFDEEELTKTLIESYLQEVTFPFSVLKFNEFDANLIPNTEEKKIIIVNVNKTNSKILAEIGKLTQNKNNLFLLISYDKSADLQVNALRTGAKDFLFKPIIQSDFINTITKIYKSFIMQNDVNVSAKVYSVLSVERAVGKTFFAFNLAKELADLTKEKVLIIDFNNNLNDLFSILDMNITYNTPYFVNKTTPENAKELFSMLPKYKNSSLYIMGNGTLRNSESKVNDMKIASFYNEVKKHFKYIIVDNNAELRIPSIETISQSVVSYLVITPSVTDTELAKVYIDNSLSNKPVRVILNKYNAKKDEPLLDKIEQILNKQIFVKIPKNIVATSAAFSKGVSIKEVSPKLDIVQTYIELAKYMVSKD